MDPLILWLSDNLPETCCGGLVLLATLVLYRAGYLPRFNATTKKKGKP